MTSRERVKASLNHTQPDFTPCDYFGTWEIDEALTKHFGVTTREQVSERLGTDIRYINPPYIGPEVPPGVNGYTPDVWGYQLRPTPNEYGHYNEPVSYPYAEFETVEQAEKFRWPSADWFDYHAIPAMCAEYPDMAIATGRFGLHDLINGVVFGRGFEQVLMDIAVEDPVYLYIMEKRHLFTLEKVERTLQAAEGRIDLVLCGDDFGSQRGLLISPEKFEALFAAKKKEFFDMVHSYGAKITHHCCGSSRRLIPRFIDIGMDALQTIQPQAAGMNPYDLKKAFAGKITFHGAVDTQGWIQRANPKEIKEEVNRLMDEVGRDGDFILAPCHNFQPDTPLESILAIYDAVVQRRKQ